MSAIEEGRRATQRDFYERLQDKSRRGWEKQKEALWEELGRHGMGGGGDKGSDSISKKRDGNVNVSLFSLLSFQVADSRHVTGIYIDSFRFRRR